MKTKINLFSIGFIILQLITVSSLIKAQPNWNVNPSAFEYNASVIAEVYLNGESDKGTISTLGAFVGEECRGVSTPVDIGGKLIYFLTVYSNSTSETITFKCYIPVKNKIISSGYSIAFNPNGIYGSIGNPIQITINYLLDNPPLVSNIPDQTVNYGGTFSTFDLDNYLTELDGENVVWSYSGNTQLIVSINNQNVVTVQKPNATWSGSETITFTATDDKPGGKSGSDQSTFTIRVDNAPLISDIPNQTVNYGGTFSTFDLDNYLTELDGENVVWSYSGNTQLIVSINNQNVVTVQKPNATWSGSETITFTATDDKPGGKSGSDQSTFTILESNNPPWNVIPSNYQYTASVVAEVYLNGSPDNGNVSVVGAFSGNECRGVAIPQNIGGKYIYFLTVYSNSTSETITFKCYIPARNKIVLSGSSTSITPNGVYGSIGIPFIVNIDFILDNAPVVSNIPDQTVEYGGIFTTFDLDNYLTELDGESVVWSYSGNTQLNVSINSQNIVTIQKPNDLWFGSESITFTATDNKPGGKSGSDQATFTVNLGNQPPVIGIIPNQSVAEGSAFAQINLDNYVNDLNNSKNQLSWTASGMVNLEIVISATRTATITAKNADWNGSETLTFRVEDPGGLNSTRSVIFTVTPVNDPPVIGQLPVITFSEGETYQQRLTDLLVHVTDVDNSVGDLRVSYSYVGNKLIITENPSGVLKISSIAYWSGEETITINVSDGIETSTRGLTVRVNAINHPPVIKGLPSKVTITPGKSYQINLWDYVSDFESPNNKLACIVFSTNNNVLVSYNKNDGQLIINTLSSFAGSCLIYIVVVDDMLESVQGQIELVADTVADIENELIPSTTDIYQNYPNPFNPSTKIKYSIRHGEVLPVTLKIYDIRGEEIIELINEIQPGGWYEVAFDTKISGNLLPSGIYLCVFRAGSFNKITKMILLK